MAQKDHFTSFTPATITVFSGANPARVARRWIAKDIWSLSSHKLVTFRSEDEDDYEHAHKIWRPKFFEVRVLRTENS